MSATPFEAAYPLSPMQQGMLFHSLYAPASGAYVTQVSCRLDPLSEADREALEQAWQRVVDRHAILRSAFVWKQTEQPLQVVGKRVQLPIERQDWRATPRGRQAARLAAFLEADRRRDFEPSRAPLMRLALLRLDEAVHQLVWSHHHLLLDGWSVPILLREVFACYRALRAGGEPALPAPRPYGDYIAWLERQDLAAAAAFWRRRLAGFVEPTPLPEDRGHGAAQAGEVAERVLVLPPAATVAARGLARRAAVTLGTVAQAAWAVLLGRCAGRGDVVFGVTVAGRPEELPGAESMVGLFINTLPARVALPERQPVAEWLGGLQREQAEARQYEHAPLVKVHGWSELPRGAALFASLLVFENYPAGWGEAAGGGGAAAEGKRGDGGGAGDGGTGGTGDGTRLADVRTHETTNYPLALLVGPGARLALRLQYDRGRFAPAAAERMLAHLGELLAGMSAAPERAVGALSQLTAAERHQLLVEWHPGPRARREPRCLHQLVAAAAAASPDAVAAWCGGAALSYGELERRSGRLARRLRRLGAGPEVPIGICAERSLELIVGLLGILKAGSAFLPLDPEQPAERLAWLLAATRPAAVLTQGPGGAALAAAAAAPAATGAPPAMSLDDGREAVADEPASTAAVPADERNLAYVIFTSGSTGRPKGVMVDHRGICNRLLWMQETRPLGPADRVVQKTPISFDVSIWELFWPLMAGARLVFARPQGHRDSRYLAELIASEEVTVAHFVPSLLQVFVEEPGAADCRRLRRVLASGEALGRDLEERFFRRLDATLENLYGPTEASIEVTFWNCERDSRRDFVPIGRPIANLDIRLLDAARRPVPVGVAGELCIGGAGLARGYVGRPELTAEAFVPDPWSAAPGRRLYRSGDLARHLPDGTVEYLGRIDDQVKVRGFRIEPAEVEAALAGHPAVQAVAVAVRGFGPGDRRLVAYVVAPLAAAGLAGELRRHLQATLPEFMVPSLFVVVEALPLTASGKLDRRRLPEVTAAALPAAGAVMPRTPVEQELARIWSEVLGRERVGVLDNFFELGGDSILCLQIVARAHRAGIHLTPRQLFEHPTVAGLAEVAGEAPQVAAEQGPVSGPLPLTPIQHWFFEQDLASPHHFNQALLLVPAEPLAPAAIPAIDAAVELLAAHHDALRLRFRRDGSGWHQVNAAPGAGGGRLCCTIDLRALPRGAFAGAVTAAAGAVQASLDLERGPLLRVVLFQAPPPEPGRLLVVVHHLAVDGVSWRILTEDLAFAYEKLRRGERPELPPKSASFRAWAHRLAEHAESPAARGELAHWSALAQAAAAPLPTDLPGDGAANLQGSARTAAAALTADETRALLEDAPRAYGTGIEDVLLAALARALAEWTGGRRVLVDVEGHGREELFPGCDVSRTVGWFTTIHPLLLEAAADAAGPEAAIQAVKERRRQVPAGGAGYGVLRYLCAEPEVRDAMRALPRAEVLFNYLGQVDQALGQVPAFRLAPEGVGPSVAETGRRSHLLQVSAQVLNRRLRLVVVYSAARHLAATAERLAERFAAHLRAAAAHCREAGTGGYSPADFPDLDLDQRQLDELVAEVARIDGEGAPP